MDHKINIKLSSKKGKSNNITFDIKGDSEHGLDKSIINSIRIMSFLNSLTICKIWSKYLEVIQSLINLVDTDSKT